MSFICSFRSTGTVSISVEQCGLMDRLGSRNVPSYPKNRSDTRFPPMTKRVHIGITHTAGRNTAMDCEVRWLSTIPTIPTRRCTMLTMVSRFCLYTASPHRPSV